MGKKIGVLRVLINHRLIITTFRPQMNLDGKTPLSEMAGIRIEGYNRRIILIQNTSKTN
jgi:hypothetical protein